MKVDNVEIKLQKPIVDTVADIIRKKIINGEIRHNLKLSTRLLSEELGISRTPVREAIRRLESEGLIDLLPRKGFTVKEYTREKIKEIYSIRKILEVYAAKLACKNITAKELNNIRKISINLNNALQMEKKGILNIEKLNREFHFAIYDASHNETLCEIIKNLWFRVSGLFITIFSICDRSKMTPREHGRILRAIEKRNEKETEKALEEHLKINEEILLTYYRRRRETELLPRNSFKV